MSGSDYAAIYAALQTRLRQASSGHGRDGRHAFGACPTCRVHVCISHHHCLRVAR
jgi:hypothetical protein